LSGGVNVSVAIAAAPKRIKIKASAPATAQTFHSDKKGMSLSIKFISQKTE
jgi:hypothetical protein